MNARITLKTIMISCIVLLLSLLLFSCGDDETTNPINVAPLSPSNPTPADDATDIDIAVSLTWECSDPDNDAITYDVFIGTDSDNLELAGESQNELSYTPNTLEYETAYFWRVVAKDNAGNQTSSDVWSFTTASEPNNFPAKPSNPSPAQNAEGISITPTFTWECSDPDNDAITYDVFLGASSDNLELAIESQDGLSYKPNTLEYGTAYFWQIVAEDEDGNQTSGDVWTFTTITEPNEAPAAPSNPSPAQNAVDVSITPTFTWECSDPDNDAITYDVYLGTDVNNLNLESEGQSDAGYTPNTLEYETVYYWKIVAEDNHVNQTSGDIWTFTTITEPNEAPVTPSNPSPAQNAEDVSITPTFTWECSDPDDDALTYNVYLGTDANNMNLESEGQSDAGYTPNTLEYETVYYWKITAIDDHNNQTESDTWIFTTVKDISIVQIEWCMVPAGEYTFGASDLKDTIDYDYEIMKYEVTCTQYLNFLNEVYAAGDIYIAESRVYGGLSAWGFWEGYSGVFPEGNYQYIWFLADGKWIEWDNDQEIFYIATPNMENNPVPHVTSIGAYMFAKHYGWRLPDQYEFQKAGRGNTGSKYSWGETIDGSNANYVYSGDPFDNESTPVGYYNGENHDGFQTTNSPSPYGVYDMTGNMSESVWTWTNNGEGYIHIYGGSYGHEIQYLPIYTSTILFPYMAAENIGFRCVRDVN